ncbi:MAG: arginyltransferase [Acidobacteria bacterium]|nr:arginyltransferase [Acidobacteriota bacterium]
MREILAHVTESQPSCPYGTGRECVIETCLMTGVPPGEYEILLERGWRRFGASYFRPVCPECTACVSLRVSADRFRFRRRHRRALRRLEAYRVVLGPPRFDAERLRLHRRWFDARRASRGWDPADLSGKAYASVFCRPEPVAWEIACYLGDRLAAVSLTDITPGALSAVYFYYDPDDARFSPGTFNILFHLQLALRTGRPWVYLGYHVATCPSMAYKADFRPHERLEGRPGEDDTPRWIAVEG